jgi:hypothetical protein
VIEISEQKIEKEPIQEEKGNESFISPETIKAAETLIDEVK